MRLEHLRRAAWMLLVVGAIAGADSSSTQPPERRELQASSSQKRHITIQDVVSRNTPLIKSIRWTDRDHVRIEVQVSQELAAKTFVIDSRDGSTSFTDNAGGVLSPDKLFVVRRVDDNWQLVDLRSNVAKTVALSKKSQLCMTHEPEWSRDGRFIAFIESSCDFKQAIHSSQEVSGTRILEVDRNDVTPLLASTISVISRDEASASRLLSVTGIASNLVWSPTGSLYVTRVDHVSQNPSTEILELAPTAASFRTVYETQGRMQSLQPAIKSDGSTIAAAVDVDNRNWDDFLSLVLIDPLTGIERRVTSDLPLLGKELLWSADECSVFTVVRSGGLDQIWSVSCTGQKRRLSGAPRRHFGLSLSPDGRQLAYQTEDGYGKRDVRVYDLATEMEKVIYVADEPAAKFILGEWQQLQWHSSDNVSPFGFLFLPPNVDLSKKYPLLVSVHGGGPGSRLHLEAPLTLGISPGPLEWHAWAALGYVVFVPDYRSSGDYGPVPIRKRLQSGVYSAIDDGNDITTGVLDVLKRDYIDPNRVVILGHSAGAAITYNAIVSNSKIFSAAVINEGTFPDAMSATVSLLSGKFTGGQAIGLLTEEFQSSLEKHPERFLRSSLLAAATSTTPILFLMGSEDRGGTVSWPWEVVYSLLRSGDVPTRFVRFPDEGHNYSSKQAATLAFDMCKNWFRDHTAGAAN